MTIRNSKRKEKDSEKFRLWEKDRRLRFNEKLDRLAEVLPGSGNEKWTKAQIVDQAIRFVKSKSQSSESVDIDSSSEDSSLRKRCRALERQNRRFRQIIRTRFLSSISHKEFSHLSCNQIEKLLNKQPQIEVRNSDAPSESVSSQNESVSAEEVFVAEINPVVDHSYSLVVQTEPEVEVETLNQDNYDNVEEEGDTQLDEEPPPSSEATPVDGSPTCALLPTAETVIARLPTSKASHAILTNPIIFPLVGRVTSCPKILPWPSTELVQTVSVHGRPLLSAPVTHSQDLPVWKLPKKPRKKRRAKVNTEHAPTTSSATATSLESAPAQEQGHGGLSNISEDQFQVKKSDFVSVQASSSLPEAILASEDPASEEDIPPEVPSKPEVKPSEDRKQTDEELSNQIRDEAKSDSVSKFETRPNSKKSKNNYSIAALCQISVNIGADPSGVGSDTLAVNVQSPGMISLNSVGTASPIGTPGPTPTPPTLPAQKFIKSSDGDSKKATTPGPESKVIQELQPVAQPPVEALSVETRPNFVKSDLPGCQPSSPTKNYLTQFPVVKEKSTSKISNLQPNQKLGTSYQQQKDLSVYDFQPETRNVGQTQLEPTKSHSAKENVRPTPAKEQKKSYESRSSGYAENDRWQTGRDGKHEVQHGPVVSAPVPSTGTLPMPFPEKSSVVYNDKSTNSQSYGIKSSVKLPPSTVAAYPGYGTGPVVTSGLSHYQRSSANAGMGSSAGHFHHFPYSYTSLPSHVPSAANFTSSSSNVAIHQQLPQNSHQLPLPHQQGHHQINPDFMNHNQLAGSQGPYQSYNLQNYNLPPTTNASSDHRHFASQNYCVMPGVVLQSQEKQDKTSAPPTRTDVLPHMLPQQSYLPLPGSQMPQSASLMPHDIQSNMMDSDQSNLFSVTQLVSAKSHHQPGRKSTKRSTGNSSSSRQSKHQRYGELPTVKDSQDREDQSSKKSAAKTSSRGGASLNRAGNSKSSKRSYSAESLLATEGIVIPMDTGVPNMEVDPKTSHQIYSKDFTWNIIGDQSNSANQLMFPPVSPSPASSSFFGQDLGGIDFANALFSASSEPIVSSSPVNPNRAGYGHSKRPSSNQNAYVGQPSAGDQTNVDGQQCLTQSVFDNNAFDNMSACNSSSVGNSSSNFLQSSIYIQQTSGKQYPGNTGQQSYQTGKSSGISGADMNTSAMHRQQQQQQQAEQQLILPPLSSTLVGNNPGSSYVNFNLSTIFPEINFVGDKVPGHALLHSNAPVNVPSSVSSMPKGTSSSSATSGMDMRQLATPEILPHSIAMLGHSSHQLGPVHFTGSSFSSNVMPSSLNF